MSIAELIRRLDELREQHGCLEVKVMDGDNDHPINGAGAIQVDIHEGIIRIDLTA